MKEIISRAALQLRRMMGKSSVANDMIVETRSWTSTDDFLADDTVPEFIRDELRRRQEQAEKLASVID